MKHLFLFLFQTPPLRGWLKIRVVGDKSFLAISAMVLTLFQPQGYCVACPWFSAAWVFSQKGTCTEPLKKEGMKTHKSRSLFPCLSPWVWISSRWKRIKQKEEKNQKIKHTPALLRFFIFIYYFLGFFFFFLHVRVEKLVCFFHCWISFLTTDHFHSCQCWNTWGKIAAVFFIFSAKTKSYCLL